MRVALDTILRSRYDWRLAASWSPECSGAITWSVYVDGQPMVPVCKRVTLLRLSDMRGIETRWSDAATGAVTFRGLPIDEMYVAVAWDHTGEFEMLAGGPKPATLEV